MPKRVNLDYKHQNLTDDDIVEFIEKTVKPDISSCQDSSRICLDFSFNRLGTQGLHRIAKLVEEETLVDEACVGFNLFYFSEFYNTLAEVQLTRIVEEQRIFMASSAYDLKLERLFAKFEEARHCDMQTLNQQLRESAASVKNFTDAVKRLETSVADILGWQKGQNDRLEVQMTSAVQSLLCAGDTLDMSELPREYHNVLGMEPVLPQGFKWDGVLFSSPPETIWLLEAKSALSTGQINDMADRMARTSGFLHLLYTDQLPVQGSQLRKKQLCRAWKVFSQMPKIVGVVAALGFTEEQLSAAAEHNIKCVFLSGDAFTMV